MRNIFLILASVFIVCGCNNKSERFEDLLQLSSARFFVREIPDEIEENGGIDFGYQKDGNAFTYIGTFYPEENSNSIDLYFFANPMRIGFVSGSKSGVMAIKLPANMQFDSTLVGEEKGDFSEPIITLWSSQNESDSERQKIVFKLYERDD